jgi:hypothetical protein
VSKLLVDEISDADNTGPVTVTDGAVVNRTGDGTIIDLQSSGTTVGSISSAFSSSIAIDGAANRSGLYLATSSLVPRYNASNIDATVDLGATSTRFKDLYLSGGVYLGGTGAANHLDDYEEGTWTPVITAEGGSAASITVNTATYTKVGRLVSLVFMVTIDSISGTGPSNAIELTGMPFTINDASSGGANVGYSNLTASMSGTLAFQGNTTTKYRIVNLNGLTGLNASDHLTGGSILRAQFIYHSA